IAVAPIAYTQRGDAPQFRDVSGDNHPLHVLWLGQVNLRKGIQYLMQAAQRLSGENIEFRIVGPIGISQDALATAPANMRFEGSVPRLDASNAYRWADVFVLPTLSDGFAITQLEAMSHGLSVIATPNCGDVVGHEEDGLIVPIRDAEALANSILRLHRD